MTHLDAGRLPVAVEKLAQAASLGSADGNFYLGLAYDDLIGRDANDEPPVEPRLAARARAQSARRRRPRRRAHDAPATQRRAPLGRTRLRARQAGAAALIRLRCANGRRLLVPCTMVPVPVPLRRSFGSGRRPTMVCRVRHAVSRALSSVRSRPRSHDMVFVSSTRTFVRRRDCCSGVSACRLSPGTWYTTSVRPSARAYWMMGGFLIHRSRDTCLGGAEYRAHTPHGVMP